METKQKDEEIYQMYKGTEFTNHYTVPPEGFSGGFALSWKDTIQIEILFSSANVIDTKIVFNGKTFLCHTSMELQIKKRDQSSRKS